jgi:Peptidase family S41
VRAVPLVLVSAFASLPWLSGCTGSCPNTVGATSIAPAPSPPAAPAPAPAGQKLDAWLSALNTADRAALERVHAGRAAERRAARDLAVADQIGGFEIHHIEEATPTERIALVREKKTGQWRCLSFAVEPEPPHAIEMILLRPAEPPSDGKSAASAPFDDGARREVVDALVRELNRAYVFPEKAAAMEGELRARQHTYEKLTGKLAFGRALTEDMQRVTHDRHLHLEVSCAETAPPSTGPGPRVPMFGETRRLDGNVAYIEITTFNNAASEVRDDFRQTMSAAADASAMIVDVRRNGGGEPEPVALVSSYLFGSEAVHLGSIHWRLSDKTVDFFTDPHVPGAKFGSEKPVYLLTSVHTFSAAEAFVYDLQARKRVVVVGETTGGGAHPGDVVVLPHGFTVFVPNGRSINPVTKTDWEGVGVKPDVVVPADAALETAHKLALVRAADNGPKRGREVGPRKAAPGSRPKPQAEHP